MHGVFIHTRNLKKSAAWYSWLLGLPFREEDVQSPVYNLPTKEGSYLTIDDHCNDPSYQFEPIKTPVFNFCSNDLKRTYEDLKEQQVPIVREIEQHGDFGWFNIEDPDGHVVMVCGDIR
ncbi:VOC family protein [Halobacillus salinarum]|uniref:VOC family protein n=1 Tax=Halobacillus salinarum TaxID=2932257 RepID=A0ABY4EL48_9BACI|nr:VOC family protein [Halobacillus salinarum]UOQ44369.1 VOC family protein [Halobacillus salinarum]